MIIVVVLKAYKPEFVIYASLITAALIITLLVPKITAIIELINNLSIKASINTEFINLLLKITAIAFLTEFAVSICKDSGENAIANKIDIGGKVIIVSMSIPIISSLMQTIIKVLP